MRGGGPLLVIAGAGSGKTNTLATRVAHLVAGGADPVAHPAAHLLAAGQRGNDPPRRTNPRGPFRRCRAPIADALAFVRHVSRGGRPHPA